MYNDSHVRVKFPEPRRSAATGLVKKQHVVGTGDGDFFLPATPAELQGYRPELEIDHD